MRNLVFKAPSTAEVACITVMYVKVNFRPPFFKLILLSLFSSKTSAVSRSTTHEPRTNFLFVPHCFMNLVAQMGLGGVAVRRE